MKEEAYSQAEMVEAIIYRTFGVEPKRLVIRDALLQARDSAFEEAAKVAESLYPRGGAHTYASENCDRYVALEDAGEAIAAAIRALKSKP